MSILEQLCIKHGTNKVWHGYPSFYEKLFNDIRLNPLNFLEIGIDQGGSLFAWQEYFSNSTIYGIDIVIPNRIANQSTKRQLFFVQNAMYCTPIRLNVSNMVRR